jgi:hypothetical protein
MLNWLKVAEKTGIGYHKIHRALNNKGKVHLTLDDYEKINNAVLEHLKTLKVYVKNHRGENVFDDKGVLIRPANPGTVGCDESKQKVVESIFDL